MFVVFDSPYNAYYVGQNVTGRLVVRVQKQKKFRSELPPLVNKVFRYCELKHDCRTWNDEPFVTLFIELA